MKMKETMIMHYYDDLIEALKRESELSTCTESQKAANAHMINMYQSLKNKRTSDSPTYDHGNLAIEVLAMRLADPSFRFCPSADWLKQ